MEIMVVNKTFNQEQFVNFLLNREIKCFSSKLFVALTYVLEYSIKLKIEKVHLLKRNINLK